MTCSSSNASGSTQTEIKQIKTKQSCYEHWHAGSSGLSFRLLGKIPLSGIVGLCGKCVLNFIRDYQTDFQSGRASAPPSATHTGAPVGVFAVSPGGSVVPAGL